MVCKVAPKISTPTHRAVCRQPTTAKDQEVVDYETALDSAGYGRFSLSTLGACIGAFFSTGVQNCVMSYVLPAAKCELHLTTYQSGLINMAFMGGGVASAFFWGIVGDVYGRRRTLSMTLLLDAVIMLAQSFVTDYRLLLVARAVNGFLIGGPSTLTFTYLSDLVGVKRRQFYLNLVGMSFVAAWLILPAAAWVTIPFNAGHRSNLPIYSWRLYLALGSIPGLISGLWVMCLPESPRLLNDTNRGDMAVKLMESIHRGNRVKEDFKIKKILSSDISVPKAVDGDVSRTKTLFFGVLRDLKMFVSKDYAIKSSLILFVFFANMAAGFGLNLWIPELLLRLQSNPCPSSLPENAKLFTVHNTTWHDLQKSVGAVLYRDMNDSNGSWREKTCDDRIDDDVFISGVIVGAICVVGAAVCGAGCAGRGAEGVRRAAAACAGACAVACLCLAHTACSCAGSGKVAVAAAAVLNAASLNGNVLLIRLLLLALPAKLSGLGVCWGAWWGRAGGVASNFAVGVLLDYSCQAPFIAVAALLALSIGGIMLIKLENNQELIQTEIQTEENNLDKNLSGLDRYISTHM